ncbi:transglycosylase SLT domain-containing protein [Nocardioides albidus]|nr:transglycosylase SLT domain-containing protein [Nocardioides albidus]
MGGRASVLCAVALLLTGCGTGPPSTAPDPAPTAPSPTAPAPTTSSPAPATQPTEVARSGARADVPTIEIMKQLARRAERIAKRLPPVVVPTDVDPASNRGLGYREMIEFGFPRDQWAYLDALWQRESGWSHLAENPSSGAYGIPQSLPATKMAVVGSDWRTNPQTQIRWGLAYIAARYGSAQKAWEHSQRTGWY